MWPGKPIIVVRDDAMPVSHPLEINAVAVAADDELRLRAEISYVRTLITRSRRGGSSTGRRILALAAPDTLANSAGSPRPIH